MSRGQDLGKESGDISHMRSLDCVIEEEEAEEEVCMCKRIFKDESLKMDMGYRRSTDMKTSRRVIRSIFVIFCHREQAGRPACPLDPFFIVPDKCKCVDFQTLKLQECPEAVPNGELPRHIQLYCDR